MSQIPFLRLLIPIVCGILFCKLFPASGHFIYIGITSLIIITYGFIKLRKSYFTSLRILSIGFLLYLFSLTIYSYQIREKQVEYSFTQDQKSYFGEILDFPQQKNRSVACEVQLDYPISKKILLYIEKEDRSQELKPGDQILFHAFVNPIKNMGNPDEFDYKSFMEGKGFSGTAFVSSIDWSHTGIQSHSLKANALRVRGEILDIYKTFNLNHDDYAFLSALTLGYKADLSNEVDCLFHHYILFLISWKARSKFYHKAIICLIVSLGICLHYWLSRLCYKSSVYVINCVCWKYFSPKRFYL